MSGRSIQILKLAVLCVIWSIFPLVGRAQDELPTAQQKEIVLELYKFCQPAKSLEDYSAALERCEKTPREGLNKARQDYIDRLTAYVANKRGEKHAAMAGEQYAAGKIEAATESDKKALADFQLSVKKDPTPWKSRHNRGVSFAAFGQFEKAIEDFTFVLKAKPDYANDWFNRGEAHYAMGNFEKAIHDFDRVVRLEPRDVDAFSRRGHAKFQLEKFEEALADFTIVVEFQPESANARVDRADTYFSSGLWQFAANDYRKAIELDPKLGRAYQSAAWMMATCPNRSFRDPARALESANKAIELDGEDNAQALDALAAAQANRAMFDKAIESIKRAIELTPESQRPPLDFRLKGYQQQQPYRHGMFKSQSDDS